MLPFPWERAMPISPTYALLAQMPRAPLAEFPFYGERVASSTCTPSTCSSRPRTGCRWSTATATTSRTISAKTASVLDVVPVDRHLRGAATHRVRYIGIHWDMYGPRQEEIRTRLVPFARTSGCSPSDETMTLYEIMSFP